MRRRCRGLLRLREGLVLLPLHHTLQWPHAVQLHPGFLRIKGGSQPHHRGGDGATLHSHRSMRVLLTTGPSFAGRSFWVSTQVEEKDASYYHKNNGSNGEANREPGD